MAEKDSNRYRTYEPYPTIGKQNNTNSNSLKRDEHPGQLKNTYTTTSVGGASTATTATGNNGITSHQKTRRKCCKCMGPKSAPFWASLLTNLGICTLLFAYTLLGSFIFLAIEGGASTMQQRTLASTNRQMSRPTTTHAAAAAAASSSSSSNIGASSLSKSKMTTASSKPSSSSSSSSPSITTSLQQRLENVTLSQGAINDAMEARQKTVENIWDITVSLNILYRENWTRLAALEIARFQDQLIKRFTEDVTSQLIDDYNNLHSNNLPSTGAVMLMPYQKYQLPEYEWTFARAFLYSLTVLTTIGYGNIAPRTTLGRIVTLAYAVLGIPLTLIYLSSTGGVLARVARGVFSRALCCCLCSNCGYCCYDEKRMAEKERRMKKKRQQEELRAQQLALQEPYYVRSGSLHNNLHSPDKHIQLPEIDSLSASESRASMHGLSLLAPILLCIAMMMVYIMIGAIVLYRLEGWPLLDGIYFCFMSLSTIGFGDLVPGLRKESSTTTWFCSLYIMCGMALTAMCFNVLHQEIVHRIKHVVEIKQNNITNNSEKDDHHNDYLNS